MSCPSTKIFQSRVHNVSVFCGFPDCIFLHTMSTVYTEINCIFCPHSLAECPSLVAQMVKRLPTMQETRVRPWVAKNPWRRK